MTSPPLKWAGGKRRLLKHILPLVPRFAGVYREPFVGGGAVFFALQPDAAVLSDTNPILMSAYRGIRDNVDAVISKLNYILSQQDLLGSKGCYEIVRTNRLGGCDDTGFAAWLIYVNRTGFNGLYRVNKKGEFNVPWGKREFSFDTDKLREASLALSGSGSKLRVSLRCEDFEKAIDSANPGDFVYCDPPYDGTYTGYTAGGFTEADQWRLVRALARAKRRGVSIMLSNSDTPLIRQMYNDFTLFTITELSAQRSIAADGGKRQRVRELIIQ